MNGLIGKRALVVLTSTASFPDDGGDTGYFADEFATPYYALRDAGVEVTIASITGGPAPMDPGSLDDGKAHAPAVARLLGDERVMAELEETSSVADLKAPEFDLVLLPGGHGTMWDFAQSRALASLVGDAFQRGAVVAAVCHGAAGLVSALDEGGAPIVAGRRVNAFTNEEERAVGLDDTVPYLLESALREKGARFESGDTFEPFAVRDGQLVTGQNPASVSRVASLMLEALEMQQARSAA